MNRSSGLSALSQTMFLSVFLASCGGGMENVSEGQQAQEVSEDECLTGENIREIMELTTNHLELGGDWQGEPSVYADDLSVYEAYDELKGVVDVQVCVSERALGAVCGVGDELWMATRQMALFLSAYKYQESGGDLDQLSHFTMRLSDEMATYQCARVFQAR